MHTAQMLPTLSLTCSSQAYTCVAIRMGAQPSGRHEPCACPHRTHMHTAPPVLSTCAHCTDRCLGALPHVHQTQSAVTVTRIPPPVGHIQNTCAQDHSHLYLCTALHKELKASFAVVLGMHCFTSSSDSSGTGKNYAHFIVKKTKAETALANCQEMQTRQEESRDQNNAAACLSTACHPLQAGQRAVGGA